jgi:hypothetical protein
MKRTPPGEILTNLTTQSKMEFGLPVQQSLTNSRRISEEDISMTTLSSITTVAPTKVLIAIR